MRYKNGQNLHRILHIHAFKAYKHLNNNKLYSYEKDLKFCGGNPVRVRFPPPALLRGGRFWLIPLRAILPESSHPRSEKLHVEALLRRGRQRDAGPNPAETGSAHTPLSLYLRSEKLRVEALHLFRGGRQCDTSRSARGEPSGPGNGRESPSPRQMSRF